MNEPSPNNIEKCKKVMEKAPPLMAMFDIRDIVAGGTVMLFPWIILLLIVFIIIII